jgi:hypothetical protein
MQKISITKPNKTLNLTEKRGASICSVRKFLAGQKFWRVFQQVSLLVAKNPDRR